MSVIQPPPPPRTPPDNLALSAARSAGKFALFATASLIVVCLALSRLSLGTGSASSTLSREFFALALGLIGLFGIVCSVWAVFSLIRGQRRRQHQNESAQNVEHRKPMTKRSASPAKRIVLAIIGLADAVLGILAMLVTLPPIWMILVSVLLIVLAMAVGALWEIRKQTPMYRMKVTR